ncbi:MAG: rod shape-determining protein MreC [Lachnospiraceae bacterium]|nr:rod shape-determining protein MreC [Lachnospiraceae bacterium]
MPRKRRRRRRNEKRIITILPKHVFFLLVFLTAVLMFLSYRFPTLLLPVRNAVDTIVLPMQKGINVVGRSVADRLDTLESIEELQQENDRLKAELEILRQEAQIIASEKYELDAMRELFNLDQKYPDYEKVAARIIARESNGWYSVFTIDKGYEDGIAVNMNVMAGNGLVGIVTAVRKNSATIRSIIDDSSNVSGMVLRTSDTCIVSGDLNLVMTEGKIKITMLPLDTTVRENEEIVTSHISDKYQQGILIGYISKIEEDSSGMTKNAYLTPVVDFEHLDEVLIITKLKESFDLDE